MLKLPHVYTIPAGAPFALTLARCLWDEYKDDLLALSDVEIYLPNRRSCRTLAETFLEISDGRATLLPKLTPLGDIEDDDLLEADPFILDESPFLKPSINGLERQVILSKLVSAKDPLATPAQAFAMAGDLAALIDRAHTESIDLDNLGALVTGDLAKHWQKTVDFLTIVTKAWPAYLEERDLLDPAARRNVVLEKKAESLRRNPPNHRIIAAGSTGSIPATASLLDIIARLPNGCVILPGFDPSIDFKTWDAIDCQHPFYFQKKLLERFTIEPSQVKILPSADCCDESKKKKDIILTALQPEDIFDLSAITPDIPTLEKLEFVSADHPAHEARIIAIKLRQLLDQPKKTAMVVTADRALARQIQLEMKRWNIAIDDSGGESLHQRPISIFLRLIAELSASPTPATHLLSILRHELTHLKRSKADLYAEINLLESELRKEPLPLNRLAGFAETNEIPLLREVLDIFAPLLANDIHPMKEWIKWHSAIAESLATQTDTIGADNLWIEDDGEALANLLHQFLNLDESADLVINISDYAAFITMAFEQVTLRPTTRLHPRLRILSPIEARLQQADLVILAGVNETVWPQKTSVDAWLSRPMRETMGFMDSETRIGQSALDFMTLFCMQNVTITWSTQRDAAQSLPSRWLQQLFAVMEKAKVKIDTQNVEAFHLAKIWDQPATLSPTQIPAPKPPLDARPRNISVTDIEKWQKDPYTIYAKKILGLYPQELLDRTLDVRDWGNAAHEVLEIFFKDKLHLAENAAEQFDILSKQILKNYPLNASQSLKWSTRLKNIRDWVITEARKEQKEILVEQKRSQRFTVGDITIDVHGRTDRIDIFAHSGSITDYKTGVIPDKKQLTNGTAPQLPLLGILFEKDATITLLRYIHLTGTEDEPVTTTNFANADELIALNREHLNTLFTKFYTDGAPFQANAFPARQYDIYKTLKRVQEWNVASDDEEDAT